MGERVVESVKGQQQNTKLRDQLDNTTRLLDLRPEHRELRISFSKYMEEMWYVLSLSRDEAGF